MNFILENKLNIEAVNSGRVICSIIILFNVVKISVCRSSSRIFIYLFIIYLLWYINDDNNYLKLWYLSCLWHNLHTPFWAIGSICHRRLFRPIYCRSSEALNVFLIMSQRQSHYGRSCSGVKQGPRLQEAMINVWDVKEAAAEAAEAEEAAAAATDSPAGSRNKWSSRRDDDNKEKSTWGWWGWVRRGDSRVVGY